MAPFWMENKLVQTHPPPKSSKVIWRTKMQGRVVRGLTQVSEGASVGVGSQWL